MVDDPTIGEVKYKCPSCTHTWFHVKEIQTKDFHVDHVTWKYRDLAKRDDIHSKRISILKKAVRFPPKSVLDVGCGDCRFLELVGARNSVGIDINKHIDPSPSIEFIHGSFQGRSIPGEYELVTSFHSMEHVVDISSFIEKMKILSSIAIAIEIPSKRRMRFFEDHVHGFNPKSFYRFIEIHSGDFKTICFEKNIQGSSLLWVGAKK